MLSAAAVLEQANARHGTSWILGSRLSGGYQSGAFLLSDRSGQRAVLKWTPSADWADTVLAAAPIIAAARAQGWPTPAWSAVGTTSDGSPYQVQEFVDGAPQDAVTHAWLDLVLPVLAAQEGLGGDGMRDWSAHDHRVVFAGEGGHRALLSRTSDAGARLVETVTGVTRPHREVVMPSADLVHGDLDPSNVLIRGGAVVGLVDAEAVGRGTRLHDLADLALHTALWDSRDVHDRLVEECRAVARRGWFEVALGSIALGLMAFGVRNWSRADLDAACDDCSATLRRLFRAS